MTSALVEEAVKKASLAWVAVGDQAARGLWCMPYEGALLVVSGPGEQAAPGLAEAARAEVRLRGDSGGLIVIWQATVSRITPGTEDWDTAVPQLAAKRLNASGTTEALIARWAADGCAVVRLTPADEEALAAPHLPDGSQAEEPRESSARTTAHKPFRLHRVRKRK